jgi:hypothetical protein
MKEPTNLKKRDESIPDSRKQSQFNPIGKKKLSQSLKLWANGNNPLQI